MDANKIKKLIEDYHSTPSICKHLGVSFDRNRGKIEEVALRLGLLEHLVENNKTSNPNNTNVFRLHSQVGQQILYDLNNELTMVDICSKYGVTRSAMRRYVKTFNLQHLVVRNKYKSDCFRLKLNSEHIKANNLFHRKHDRQAILEYIHQNASLSTKAELIRDCKQRFGVSKTFCQKLIANVTCRRHSNRGSNNSMFGIAPSPTSGRGASGRLVYGGYDVHFRSSLELRVFLSLINSNTAFCLSKHRIPYYYKGTNRTYNPDIVIGDVVYEIKPNKLIDLELNTIKFKALREYCNQFSLKCGYITENTYDTSFFTEDYFSKMLESGCIVLSEANADKILRYIK